MKAKQLHCHANIAEWLYIRSAYADDALSAQRAAGVAMIHHHISARAFFRTRHEIAAKGERAAVQP